MEQAVIPVTQVLEVGEVQSERQPGQLCVKLREVKNKKGLRIQLSG